MDLVTPALGGLIADQIVPAVLDRLAASARPDEAEARAQDAPRPVHVLYQRDIGDQHAGIGPVARIGRITLRIFRREQRLGDIDGDALAAVAPRGPAEPG